MRADTAQNAAKPQHVTPEVQLLTFVVLIHSYQEWDNDGDGALSRDEVERCASGVTARATAVARSCAKALVKHDKMAAIYGPGGALADLSGAVVAALRLRLSNESVIGTLEEIAADADNAVRLQERELTAVKHGFLPLQATHRPITGDVFNNAAGPALPTLATPTLAYLGGGGDSFYEYVRIVLHFQRTRVRGSFKSFYNES
eukprot:SAG11_NODE_650_length_7931_cov_9.512385_6_plen_202_part_00